MFLMGLVPFIFYFIVVMLFYSYHLGNEVEETEENRNREKFLAFSIIALASYTTITEIVALIKQGT